MLATMRKLKIMFILLSLFSLLAISTLAFTSSPSSEGFSPSEKLEAIHVLIFAPPEISEEITKHLPQNHPVVKLFKVSVKTTNNLNEFIDSLKTHPSIIVAPVGAMKFLNNLRDSLIPADDYLKETGGVLEATYRSDTDKQLREACSEGSKQICFPLFAHSYILVPTGEKRYPKRLQLRDLAGSGLKITSVFSPSELSLLELAPIKASDPLSGYTYWKLAKAGKFQVAIIPAYLVKSVSVKDVPTDFSLYPIMVDSATLGRVPFNLYGVFIFKPSERAKRLIAKYGKRSFDAAFLKVLNAIIGFETQKDLALRFQVIPANKQVRLHPSYINLARYDKDKPSILWANNLLYKKPKLMPDEKFRKLDEEIFKAILSSLRAKDEEPLRKTIEEIAWTNLAPEVYAKRFDRIPNIRYLVKVLEEKKLVVENRSSSLECSSVKGVFLAVKLIEKEVTNKADLDKVITLKFKVDLRDKQKNRTKHSRAKEIKYTLEKVKLRDLIEKLLSGKAKYLKATKEYLKLKEIPNSLGELLKRLNGLPSDKREILIELWGERLELGSDPKAEEAERKLPIVYANLRAGSLSLKWIELPIRDKRFTYLVATCRISPKPKRNHTAKTTAKKNVK